jgi:hypothetical protein
VLSRFLFGKSGSWCTASQWNVQSWRVALFLILLTPLRGITLEELRKDAQLTPRKFAAAFSDFEYVYHEELQPHEQFLATKKGDCDDYATLAALLLGEKGYHPHLIAVRMPGLVHVVCYIEEIKGFLDFNAREYVARTVSCKPGLDQIAKKVAKTFEANWTSATEFSFKDGLKRHIKTVVETAPYTPLANSVGTNEPSVKMDF